MYKTEEFLTNYYFYYYMSHQMQQDNSCTSDISLDKQLELKAAEGLLGLRYLACSSDVEAFQLNPIFVGDPSQTQQLPPLSCLLSEYASSPSTSISSTQSSLDHDYFYNLAAPTASELSISSMSSSSASSVHSFLSTCTLQQSNQPSFRTLIHNRRRGRPKKKLSAKMNQDLKIVNYDHVTPVTTTVGFAINKPRWQDSERQDLIEAIVKEKSLDDMSTIPWDNVSMAVGRAKKACKDQWRRELLPGLLRGFGIRYHNSSSHGNQQPYEGFGNNNYKKKRKNETRNQT